MSSKPGVRFQCRHTLRVGTKEFISQDLKGSRFLQAAARYLTNKISMCMKSSNHLGQSPPGLSRKPPSQKKRRKDICAPMSTNNLQNHIPSDDQPLGSSRKLGQEDSHSHQSNHRPETARLDDSPHCGRVERIVGAARSCCAVRQSTV